jgi:hypothetical protein
MSSRSKQLIQLALKPITAVSSDENADFSTNQVANFHIEHNEEIDIEINSVQGNYNNIIDNLNNNIHTINKLLSFI